MNVVAPPDATAESDTAPLLHTPYDGTRKSFSIALAPLDPTCWIEPDTRLAATLAERAQLIAERRDVVVREEADTRVAQREALDLVVDFVTTTYPEHYRLNGRTITVLPAGRGFDLDDESEAPLVIAAQLVSDDLLMLRKGPDGYRLIAAVLCFPSAWSLAEKFGRSLDAIHAAVPGYPDKMAKLMNRIFDNLKVDQPVWRLNWSIYPDSELHHPESKERPRDWFNDASNLAPEAFVRVERQTLRRLPETGDMLFTVRVHVDPFDAFTRHPDGPELAASLRAQLMSLNEEQLAYKGLTEHRDAVAGALDRIAKRA